MKKIIAVLIALIMMAAAVAPSFAATAESIPAPAEENRFSVWAEDASFDPSVDSYVDVYVNVSNNTDGFEYLKFFMIYPECLTLVSTEAAGFVHDDELTEGIERTKPDKLFTRALMTLRGYDVGEGDEYDTPEQKAAFEARTKELLDGKKWTSPLLDIERKTTDPNTGRRVVGDCYENGRICVMRFEYDASKNPTGDDLSIEVWADCEGGLHSEYPKKPELAEEWAYYDAYGCTVDLPYVADPTVTVSDVTIAQGDLTASFDVTVSDNPGVWGAQLFFVYDSRMKFDDFANGDVFPDSALSFSPLNEERMRDVEPSEAFTRHAFRNLKAAFEEAGVSYENKLITYAQYESPTFDDFRADGKLFSVTLDTSSLFPGEYDISIVYMPMNVINSEGENVAFKVVQGKLTVTGEPCAHANTTTDHRDASCTEDGYTKVTCNDCGEVLSEEIIPAAGHDFSVLTDTVYNSDGVSGYYVYKCSRCDETKRFYFDNTEPWEALPVAEVEAPYFKSKPVFDGIVSEDEWGEPTVFVSQADVGRSIVISEDGKPFANDLNTFFYGVPGGSYDPDVLNMSYMMWLRWDEDFYYIAVKVLDIDGHSLKNGKADLWNGDAFRTRIDPEGYNAVCPLGPELYDPYYDGPPWSRGDIDDMAFGFTQYAGGFTEAWNLANNRGMTYFSGGDARVSIAPAGVNYTYDTANGVTTYEIAVPWKYIDNYTHNYSDYNSKNPDGAIGREYGMSAVVYNADGNSQATSYNAALCWGSGILRVQQDLYTQTCGGSNKVVLTGDVIESENFTYSTGYYPAPPVIEYPHAVDESTHVILDYEDESDMDILGYFHNGEWVEEPGDPGNRVARWDLDAESESGFNEHNYLATDSDIEGVNAWSCPEGGYTAELDVKVTGTELFEPGFNSAFGFLFGGVSGIDYTCGYDFDTEMFRVADTFTGKVIAEVPGTFTLNEWHHIVFQYFKDNCEIRFYFDPETENGAVSGRADPVFRMSYRYFDDPTDRERPVVIRRMNCQTLIDNVELYNFVDLSYSYGYITTDDEPDPAKPPVKDVPEESPAPENVRKTLTKKSPMSGGFAAQTGDPLVTYIAAASIALLVMSGCAFDLHRRRKADK